MKFYAFLLVLVAACSSQADEVIRETAAGGVNWSQGVVFAHGYGTARDNLQEGQKRIMARRAAIVDGQRNLLEITKGVRITSELDTAGAMRNPTIATRVEGIIRGAVPIREHYQNSVYTVTMAMPLAGEFLKTTYPPVQTATLRPAAGVLDLRELLGATGDRIIDFLIPRAVAAADFSIQGEAEAKAYRRLIEWMRQGQVDDVGNLLAQALQDYETSSRYSGLLIDASAVPTFELATVPRIRDEEGNILYPSEATNYSDIVNKRGVTYDFDLEDAVRNQRVATTPFTIRAVSTYKSLPSDLVIKKADAARVLQSPSTLDAMNQAGVLIVVAI